MGRGVAGDAWEVPSILYGRPTEIRAGDHLGNLRFAERLRRLSYKRVAGRPSVAGTWIEEPDRVRIYTRDYRIEETPHNGGPVEIGVRDGRVVSIVSYAGVPLDSIHLEPEEIGRILGPRMESRRIVPLSAIPPSLQRAVLAAEDARFYSHHGIDAVGVARALVRNLREWRFAQGGSTITQQLAKNFFLSPKKTIGRKLREVELAIVLELRYTKQQILEMYLNKIYFGQEGARGIYGVEEAAGFYFSKRAADLTLEEAATLAGVIRSPNRYSPFRASAAAKERRDMVLARMRQLGMIGEEEYRRASRAPLRTRARRSPANMAAYFADYIQRVTEDDLGGEKLFRTGYRFHTTLDPVQQAAAEEAVAKGLAEVSTSALPAGEPLQAALVAVDPATGEMTAMVGGRGYGETQFNRAADAKRQPGSAFKPFVLLAAMERAAQGKGKTTLSTIVSGEPVSVPTPQGVWTPSNFEGKTYGNLTVRKAIEESVNTAAVRLALDVGLPEVVKSARAAGSGSPLSPVPSLALGSFEVTPVELAYAYATIASGGVRYDPFPLFSATTADGEILTAAKVHWERALDPRAAYLTGYAMEGVLDRGTAKTAKGMGISFPASGKTGTTDGNRDSWFVGFTPDVVCVAWVGYDSGADTGLTEARGALRIWARFLRALYPGSGPVRLRPPEGIEFAEIDPESGFLATTACPLVFREAYLSGTAPKEPCPLHPVNPVVDTIQRGVRGLGDFFRNLFK
ncbi:MAG TPA: PBP1A family penicillin-binding protein [Candidatus Deferrimicrobium sp.]|nr:PBP1A family penicillin-binding protein [Candidatus Deferrimicrobium sp.]